MLVNYVIGFRQVQLDKHSWIFEFSQGVDDFMGCNNAIKNLSAFHKPRLLGRDYIMDKWFKASHGNK